MAEKAEKKTTKKKMGRPTKWTKEVADKLAASLDVYVDSHPKLKHISHWVADEGLYPELVSRLQSISTDFSQSVKKVKTRCMANLQDKLLDENKPVGAMFQLKCNHGFVETQYQKVDQTNVNVNVDVKDLSKADKSRVLESIRLLSE